MRSVSNLLLGAALVALSVQSVTAQSTVQFTAGAIVSGVLLNDGVLHSKLRPGTAPLIGIGIAIPTGKGPYRVRFETHYSRSPLKVTTSSGTTDQLSSLTTIDAVVMAEGPLAGKVRWQVGGGALFYRPSENQGVFLDGPTQRWLLAGGVVFTHQLTSSLNLLVNARVDAQGFTTSVLQARNYAGSQGVERFALSFGLERKL